MAVSDYSTNATDNTAISGLTVSDATTPDTVDNIIRQLMADIKAFYDAVPSTAGTNLFTGTVDLTGATVNLAPGEIATVDIADDAVTRAKIADAAMSGSDATLVTGTAGTDGTVPKFNSDGDIVEGFTVGQAANNLVQLNTSAQLPAVDGSLLTGLGETVSAWVCFNGTGTVAIKSSSGVDSITDLGTGLYRINWTTAFANTDYLVMAMASSIGTANTVEYTSKFTAKATTSVTLGTLGGAGYADFNEISVLAIGI